MKISQTALCIATVFTLLANSAFAQQTSMGTITRLDEGGGKITIQQAMPASGSAVSTTDPMEYKVSDGLVFNAFQIGDKVSFTAAEIDVFKMITKLEKQ